MTTAAGAELDDQQDDTTPPPAPPAPKPEPVKQAPGRISPMNGPIEPYTEPR